MIEPRALLDAVRDAVFIADIDTGMIVDANRAAECLCGRSVTELRSMHHTHLHPPEALTSATRAFQENAQIVEETVVHKDGRRIPVEISASHYTAPDGKRMLIGVFRNLSERNAARDSVQRSEERFRRVAETADEFIWEVDAAGLYTYASPAVERILGYTPEEIVGQKHFYDLFVPETREELKRGAFEVFARQERFRGFLNWNVRKDGTPVALETRGGPMLDASGVLIGYYGADTDVTERKRAEAALRESEEKFTKLFRCSPVSITVSDLNDSDRFIEVNDAFEKFTGHSRDEVIGRTYPPDWLWSDPDEYTRAVSEMTQNGRLHNFEFHFRKTTGEIRTGLLSAETIEVKGRRFLLATTIDVTERRRAEEARRESEERFRSLFENATVGIYRTTPSGKIEIANPALVKMLGYESFADLADRNLEESGFEPEYCRSDFRKAVEEKGQIRGLESAWTRRDGSTVYVRESARCIRDEPGNVRYYEGIVEDVTERHEVEDELRQSEQKFAAAFRLGPAAMSIVDTEHGNRILDVNEGFEQVSGWSRVELIGQKAVEIGMWPIAKEYLEAKRRFGTQGRLRNYECHFRTKSGETRTGLISAERMDVGNRRLAITCMVDITERKQAEAALHDSQARLADAQRLAKVGSWQLELLTGKVRWSEEMYRMYGVPTGEEPDFRTFLTYVHPRDRDRIREGQAQCVARNAPVETEFRFIRPDGSVRHVRAIVEPMRDDKGALTGFRGAAQDITERVSATEQLRESEKRLLNAERIAHVGNWRWDVQNRRVIWSEELLRIFGSPKDITPGYDPFLDMVVPEDRERVAQWVRDCLAGKPGNVLEFRISRPNGEVRTVRSVIEVAFDEDGQPENVAGTCQDITEARRAQEEMFARQKLESLGTLASGIAHDFNNLLGGVLAQAELAMAECESGSYPDEELKGIRDVAIRGSEIVRQLMIYAGKESDLLEPVNVSHTVEDMIGLLKATVSKHVMLATDLSESLPPVKARAAQIRQLVMNLVVNASEAIKDCDGVILLTTSSLRVTADSAGTGPEGLPEGDYMRLEVSDTGRGMSREVQAKVFDPFFTTKSAGRGLGLAVVHGIVRSLNGAIRVTSEPRKGTTFEILLPCATGAAVGATSASGHAEERGILSQPATVLVVEDEDPLRSAVTKMLGKAGFVVLEAADGSQAVELLRMNGQPIDLVLLDMTIPGAASHEVLMEAVQRQPDVKVLVTSAYSEQMAMETLRAPQVIGFIRKPFEFETLIRTLREALGS